MHSRFKQDAPSRLCGAIAGHLQSTCIIPVLVPQVVHLSDPSILAYTPSPSFVPLPHLSRLLKLLCPPVCINTLRVHVRVRVCVRVYVRVRVRRARVDVCVCVSPARQDCHNSG